MKLCLLIFLAIACLAHTVRLEEMDPEDSSDSVEDPENCEYPEPDTEPDPVTVAHASGSSSAAAAASSSHSVAHASSSSSAAAASSGPWISAWSQKHGQEYYWNYETRESSWTPPNDYFDQWTRLLDPETDMPYFWNQQTGQTSLVVQNLLVVDVWTPEIDELSGAEYFLNHRNGEISWSHPMQDGASSSSNSPSSPAGAVSASSAVQPHQPPQHIFAAYLHALQLLHVHLTFDEFLQHFGEPSDVYVFGNRVWEGMQSYLHKYTRCDWKSEVEPGWFVCPARFSMSEAQRPKADGDFKVFPAWFCCWGGMWYMICKHIVIKNSKPWRYIHVTRIIRVFLQDEARTPNPHGEHYPQIE